MHCHLIGPDGAGEGGLKAAAGKVRLPHAAARRTRGRPTPHSTVDDGLSRKARVLGGRPQAVVAVGELGGRVETREARGGRRAAFPPEPTNGKQCTPSEKKGGVKRCFKCRNRPVLMRAVKIDTVGQTVNAKFL